MYSLTFISISVATAGVVPVVGVGLLRGLALGLLRHVGLRPRRLARQLLGHVRAAHYLDQALQELVLFKPLTT